LVTSLLMSWALPSVAWAQAAPPVEQRVLPPEDSKQRAETEYELGVTAYRAQRFAEAIERFQAADRLLPRAALSFNVARAYEKLGDNAGALRFYRDYLRRETGPANQNTELARQRVAELQAALMARGQQQLTVLSEPEGASLTIDDKPIGSTPWTGELPPGAHRLALLRAGHSPLAREFELPAAEALELRLVLPPLPSAAGPVSAPAAPATEPEASANQSPRPARFGPWPWVSLGAGGVALLVAGGFEFSRRAAESDAKTPGLPQIAYKDRLDAAHARQTTARVLTAIGGALVLTGGALILLDLSRTSTGRATAALACDPHSCLGHLEMRY
jgi:tetratricopeptide (TPR) repeat protein